MRDQQRLLLVEDDHDIRELLSALLVQEGYAVDSAIDGKEGETKATSEEYDLIILDIMLPEKDGLSVLRDIRPLIHKPILMLTAKGALDDKVKGLDLGADDYISKPFNPRELNARIRALLRRPGYDALTCQDTTIHTSGLTIKPNRREVVMNDQLVDLTSTEYNILIHLINHSNSIVSKEALTEYALGRKLVLYDRAIDMHMSNLRKKLPPGLIKTVRGVGYLFSSDTH